MLCCVNLRDIETDVPTRIARYALTLSQCFSLGLSDICADNKCEVCVGCRLLVSIADLVC